MQFSILGPLAVQVDGRAIDIVGVMPRGVLAMLLLHPNVPVSTESLAMALWGEDAPPRAAKTVQVHVSRLRRSLGDPEALVTVAGGYLLNVRPGELDADEFARRVAAGRQALADRDAERAGEVLCDALDMWRGPPLADVASLPFAALEIARLEEERLASLELRVEADLEAGRHAELVPELQWLTRRHPWSERLHAALMLALYRSGRQTDALDAYRAARTALRDQLGVEPGPVLRSLEQGILRHDPAVQAPARRLPAQRPEAGRLPPLFNRTIGREQAIRDVVAACRPDATLVTLVGPGGVGKTRLSIEVARELEGELSDGVSFVSLAATAEPGRVAGAIGQALGVTPVEGETPDDAVRRFLAPKRALLVLDNFDHLVPAAPLVADLLAACPALRVLASSREPLRLAAEHLFPVSPLAVPVAADVTAVELAAASALFVERCRHHDPAFTVSEDNARAIASICRRLDGLPLAIELAAARTPLLVPHELDGRLAESLDALGAAPRDAPERHRTLRATIDWSHRLLPPAQARAFARFAVFAGGATVAAAERVTGADLHALEGLVAKHLLQRRRDPAGHGRLYMLETIREYARERLAEDSAASEIHDRHCRHFLALAEQAEPALFTGAEADWLPQLDADLDNLRAAIGWSLRDGDPVLGVRVAALLAGFWDIRVMSAEGLEWLDAALTAAGDDVPIEDLALARRAQVQLLEEQGALYDTGPLRDQARAYADEALALSQRCGDPRGIAPALLLLGHLDESKSLPQTRRRALAEEALVFARQAGDDRLIADALTDRAAALPPEDAAGELAEAIAAHRRIGASRSLAMLYNRAAYHEIKAGRAERAAPYLADAESLARELGDEMLVCSVYGNAGLAALFTRDLDGARAAFDEELRLARELVIPWLASEGLAGLAAIASAHDDLDRAARLLGAATATGPLGDVDVATQLERKFFAAARERHGHDRWSDGRAAGSTLTFTDAIAVALAERVPG
jgi:predicted ATPase/DNA-binding SARP family transcriptional activator